MNLPNGTLLQGGKYRIERVLGQGGFGITYLATNTAFDETVAIKEFFWRGVNHREQEGSTVSVSNRENEQMFGEQLAKFRKEARRIRRLHNAHIIAVHDLFDENGTAYYVMDHVDGESLADWQKRVNQPMPEAEVKNYLLQVLDALAVVHSNGFWHLDVKPGNVLIDHQKQVRLIDFGASKQMKLDGGATTNTQASYTPGYAPLEQVSQRLEDVGAWTDLYAMGAMGYRLLTNQRLPECYDILLKRDAAFQFPSSVSDQMRQLIVWMMQPNHTDRPQSVADVLAKLLPRPEPEPQSMPPKTVDPKPADVDPDVTIVKPKEPSAEDAHGDDLGGLVSISNRSKARASDIERVVTRLLRNMVQVDGGVFTMGCVSGRDGSGFGDEYPAHQVLLSAFYISRYQLTQDEWETIMGENPSKFKGNRLPVTNVSWHDCQNFILRLNQYSGRTFRLPTEAEWEYAARGGRLGRNTLYAGSDRLDDVGWYDANAHHALHEVGLLMPNELGLYDMTGNVHEWCADTFYRYSANVSGYEEDPIHHDGSLQRMTRGGSWLNGAGFMRIAQRSTDNADMRSSTIGLRLAMSSMV